MTSSRLSAFAGAIFAIGGIVALTKGNLVLTIAAIALAVACALRANRLLQRLDP